MFIIILIILVGIHLAPLVIFGIDMWRAQGMWAQTGILVMLATIFIENPKRIVPRNMPVFLLILWIGLSTAFVIYKQQFGNVINVYNLLPFFNFLCVVVFYVGCVVYLSKKNIATILTFIKYCIIAEMLLCVLQKFGLSQFFQLLKSDYRHYSMIVGLLGNGTHLSGFLATTACLFFTNKRQDILSLILMGLVLTMTGTQENAPAISGYIVLVSTFMFYVFNKSRHLFFMFSMFLILAISFIAIKSNFHTDSFFGDNGRIELWQYYIKCFVDMGQTITGYGLGVIRTMFQSTKYPTAMHLHNEYLHFTFELGIVGFVVISNLVLDFLKTSVRSQESLLCKTMFFGFLVSCLFNYPAHLWMVSIYATFSYAALMALERTKKGEKDEEGHSPVVVR